MISHIFLTLCHLLRFFDFNLAKLSLTVSIFSSAINTFHTILFGYSHSLRCRVTHSVSIIINNCCSSQICSIQTSSSNTAISFLIIGRGGGLSRTSRDSLTSCCPQISGEFCGFEASSGITASQCFGVGCCCLSDVNFAMCLPCSLPRFLWQFALLNVTMT